MPINPRGNEALFRILVPNFSPGVLGACDRCRLLSPLSGKTCEKCGGPLQIDDISHEQWLYPTFRQFEKQQRAFQRRELGRVRMDNYLVAKEIKSELFDRLLQVFGKKYMKLHKLGNLSDLKPWLEEMWGSNESEALTVAHEVLAWIPRVAAEDDVWHKFLTFECKRHMYLYTYTKIAPTHLLRVIATGSESIDAELGTSPELRLANLRQLSVSDFPKFRKTVKKIVSKLEAPEKIPDWNEDRGTVNSWDSYNKYGGAKS